MKGYAIYKRTLIDIFTGDGWESWSRWLKIKDKWKQINGNPIKNTIPILKFLQEFSK